MLGWRGGCAAALPTGVPHHRHLPSRLHGPLRTARGASRRGEALAEVSRLALVLLAGPFAPPLTPHPHLHQHTSTHFFLLGKRACNYSPSVCGSSTRTGRARSIRVYNDRDIATFSRSLSLAHVLSLHSLAHTLSLTFSLSHSLALRRSTRRGPSTCARSRQQRPRLPRVGCLARRALSTSTSCGSTRRSSTVRAPSGHVRSHSRARGLSWGWAGIELGLLGRVGWARG